MPFVHRDIQRLFRVIGDYRWPICVAGGAAVDCSRAIDIDLFVLDIKHQFRDAQMIAARIGTKLLRVEQFFPDSCDGAVNRTLVCSVAVPGVSRPVQICTASYLTPHELIESFDLSVHMAAITLGGQIVRSPQTTSPTSEIRICRWTTPIATLDRARKLAERYHTTIHPADLHRLQDLITRATFTGRLLAEEEQEKEYASD